MTRHTLAPLSAALFSILAVVTTGCSSEDGGTSGDTAAAVKKKSEHLLTCKQVASDDPKAKLEGELVVDEDVMDVDDPAAALERLPQYWWLFENVSKAGIPLNKYRVEGTITTSRYGQQAVDDFYLGALHAPNEHHASNAIAAYAKANGTPAMMDNVVLEGPVADEKGVETYRLRTDPDNKGATLTLSCEGSLPSEAHVRSIDVKAGPSYFVTCETQQGTMRTVIANATAEKPTFGTVEYAIGYVPVFVQTGKAGYALGISTVDLQRDGSNLALTLESSKSRTEETFSFAAPTQSMTSGLAGTYGQTKPDQFSVKASCEAVSID